MRKTTAGLLSLALASGLGAALTVPSAAAPPDDTGPVVGTSEAPEAADHELPNPLEEKRRALKQEALTKVIEGEASVEQVNGSAVVKVGETVADAIPGADSAQAQTPTEDQYVELSNERTDKVFVFLVEFGNQRDPLYPDQDTDPDTAGPQRFDGPLFNEIPAPNPAVDNSTQWNPKYDRAYYEQLYFGEGEGVESLKTYYEKQSSGRYSVEGLVSEVVRVPYNEARYGRSNGYPCDDVVCNNTWALVRDGMNQWVLDQQAAGQTDEQIATALSEFDLVDRYDYDSDGDFNEGDGYIDKFQIVHSGGDQADGDPYQGEDAIWSHRWYAYGTDFGETGPAQNLAGGTEIGDTGFWVGDYTIQPENGGLSVVAHEYGHDLGLPDHYDTAAGGDNPVSWWTLMAQSRVSAPGDQGIGTRAADLSAWDKLQLGWFDYETVVAGQRRTLELGPHEYNTEKAQGVVVVLPDKEVTQDLGAPYEGENQYFSGAADNLENTMTRTLDLTGATTAQMTFQTRFDIEIEFDYLYAQASTDGGATWVNLDGTVDGEPFVGDTAEPPNPAISGVQADWAEAVIPMDAFAGQVVDFRFLYRTDGGVTGIDADVPDGFFADAIVVTADGVSILEDGAETGGEGWELDGFSIVGASVTAAYDNYYIASNRQYVSYDKYLQSGPYNFSFPDRPDFVEHFPYQDGLLISYWDTSYTDNNTSAHPGEGLVLPIDAHPRTKYNLQGAPWRGRIQTYDDPFSLEKADSFYLTVNGQPNYVRGEAAQPVFNDTNPLRYFTPDKTPGQRIGVKVAGAGVKIRVLEQDGTSMRIRITSTAAAG